MSLKSTHHAVIRRVVLFVMFTFIVACGGTDVPSELATSGSGSGPIEAGQSAPLMLSVQGFIGGEASSAAVASSQSKFIRKMDGTNEAISGANGLDMKDMNYSNMFSTGLSITPLPDGTQVQIAFYAEGNPVPIHSVTFTPNQGLFNANFNAQALRTGSRLELGLTLDGGEEARLMLPVLELQDGDRLGVNLARRIDNTMTAELFIDGIHNESGEEGSDGLADNGIRIVVDNSADINGDGLLDTAARMDTSEGLCFYDLDLDGRFGDPLADGVLFFDQDEDGDPEACLMVMSDSDREAGFATETRSFVFDPELDGRRNSDSQRESGETSFSDRVADVTFTATPASAPANGINSVGLDVRVRPTAGGMPMEAQFSLSVELVGAEATGGNGPRFLRTGGATTSVLLSPADPAVRLLSNGDFVFSDAVLMPVLGAMNFAKGAHLVVTLNVLGRTVDDGLTRTATIELTPSAAPILTQVLVSGQYDTSTVSGGLETVSRRARIVYGNPVQVHGENFANNPNGMSVTLGGVPVDNLVVNTAGTQLDFTVPAGAEDGPISVIVNGLGGRTSQNVVLAGAGLEVLQINPQPVDGFLPENAMFAIRMSRAIDASSVDATSVFIREIGGNPLGWTSNVVGSDTIALSQGSGTALQSGTQYEIVLTSNLQALTSDTSAPALRFDADPNVRFVTGNEEEMLEVLTFTAATPDSTAPTLVSTSPANGAIGVNASGAVTVTFSELMSAASISGAISTGELRMQAIGIQASGTFSWGLNTDGTVLTIQPDTLLKGSTTYELVLPATLTDRGGNTLAASTVSFTTALTIEELSPRSGPIGTLVRAYGGDFGTNPGAVSITLNGQTVGTPTLMGENFLEFEVPANAQSGALVVSVDGEDATAPTPFVVTIRLQVTDLPRRANSRAIGVAGLPDDSAFFMSNQGLGSISAFDLNELVEIDTDTSVANGVTALQVGSVPSEATVSIDGRYLLTLDYGTPDVPGNSFYIVGTGQGGTPRFGLVATVPVGMRPTRIAKSPDGNRWYVTNYRSDSLSVISSESPFSVVATVPTGLGPNGIEIGPRGVRGYVCNYVEGSVTIFDVASNGVIGSVPVGAGPSRAKATPDGKWLLVSCNVDNTLWVINTETARVATMRGTFGGPSAMAFARDGKSVYLCSRIQDVITRYSLDLTEAGVPSLTEIENIATGRIPSGLTLSRDGSRLLLATEGQGGGASVIFLETPVQVLEDILRTNGQTTRLADPGDMIRLTGRGFAPNPQGNRVVIGGLDAEVISEGSTRNELLVRIPEAALSGNVSVFIGDVESNALAFVINPKTPKLLRTTPGDRATGVATTASIVMRFNEAVTAASSDFQLIRALDTFTNGVRDIDPMPIAGLVETRDGGREVVFTPAQPLIELANSNNIYRFTVMTSLTDLSGNPLDRSTTIQFRLRDTRGPTLIKAQFIDVDNNGVDDQDIVNLVFDETVSASAGSLPAVVGQNGLTIGLSDGTTLGTNATLEVPNIALLERTSPPNSLDDLTRTMMLRLRTGANIVVPGANTSITSITNVTGGGIRDASGNAGLGLSGTNIDIGVALASEGQTRALSIALLDDDGDQVAEAGEIIALYANTALTALSLPTASDFTLLGAGASLGTSPQFALDPANARVLRIVLGAGANFDFTDAMSSTPTFGFEATMGLSGLVSFTNLPLQPFAADQIGYLVGQSTTGPRIAAQAGSVTFHDVDGNGPSAGDYVSVLFDQEVTVGNAPAAICFSLNVVGDNFGSGSFIRANQDLGIDPRMRSRLVDIVLGANMRVTPAGLGGAGVTAFGSASSLDVNATIPIWAVADVFGNSARPDAANGPYDVASADASPPQLLAAKLRDLNANGVIEAGDVLFLVFSETLLLNTVNVSHWSVVQGTTSFTLGTGAFLSRGPNFAINGQIIEGNTLNITFGANPTVGFLPGLRVRVNSGNPLTDFSGNQIIPLTSVALSTGLPEEPSITRAVPVDVDANGSLGAGDKIFVKFSQEVTLPTSTVATTDIFTVHNPLDSYGTGSTTSVATISEVTSAGFASMLIGSSANAILSITLGSGATFANLAGTNPAVRQSYTNTAQPTVSPTAPSAVVVRRQRALGFTQTQLTSAFDDATRTGSANRFNGLALDINGDGTADVVTDVQLPGGATSFTGSTSQFSRIVEAINQQLVIGGTRIRAVHNVLPNELVILDNGENMVSSGASILANEDIANMQSATFNAGSPAAISGVASFFAAGFGDLEPIMDTTGPALVAAFLESTTGVLTLTFDEAVVLGIGVSPSQIFSLPVAGDSFGTGASVIGLGEGGFTLMIQTGSNRVLTGMGIFNSSTTGAGSPSGIAVSASVSALILRDAAGNGPRAATVDLEASAIAPPAPEANLQLTGGFQASTDLALTGVQFPVIAIVGSTTSADTLSLSSMSFDLTTFGGAPVALNTLFDSAKLYLDVDANAMFTSGTDILLQSIPVSSGVLSFNSWVTAATWTSAAPIHFVVVMETLPTDDLGDAFVGVSLTSAPVMGTMEPATVIGLPVNGPLSSFATPVVPIPDFDTVSLDGSLFELEAFDDVDFGAAMGRLGHGAAGTRDLPRYSTKLTLKRSALLAALPSPLQGGFLHLDLTGNGSTDALLDFQASGPSAADAMMLALLQSIKNARSSLRGNGIDIRASFDDNGNLVITDTDQEGGSRFGREGHSGGLLLQGIASAAVHGGFDRSASVQGSDSETTIVVFGGQSASAHRNDVVVIRVRNGTPNMVSLPVLADPIEGSPSARRDMHFVALPGDRFLMHGGRDATTVFQDTWMLEPIFGSGFRNAQGSLVFGDVTALQWRQISFSGPQIRGGVATLALGSAAFPQLNVVLAGGAETTSSSASGNVYAFNLQTMQWSTALTATGQAMTAVSNAAGAYSVSEDAMVIWGGQSNGSALPMLQRIDFNVGGSSYTASTQTASGGTPFAGVVGSAALLEDEDGVLRIFGGLDSAGDIVAGVGKIFLSDTGNFVWSAETVPGGTSRARAFSRIVELEDGAMVLFGKDANGPSSSVFTLSAELGGDAFDGQAIVLALYEPIPTSSGGTTGTDAGETLRIVLSGSTNLLELYPSGNLSLAQLNDHIQLSDGASPIALPAGTTGSVDSTYASADTILVTFGGSLGATFPSIVTFQPNSFSSTPIEDRSGSVVADFSPICGTSDQTSFYVWTGAASDDWHTSANWSVDTGLGVPGLGSVAFVPGGTPTLVYVTSGSASIPRVNQLVIMGGRVSMNHALRISTTAANRVGMVVLAGGTLAEGTVGSSELRFENSLLTDICGIAHFFGTTRVGTINVIQSGSTGSGMHRLLLAGTLKFQGGISVVDGTTRGGIGSSTSFLPTIIAVGNQGSSLNLDHGTFERLWVDRENGSLMMNQMNGNQGSTTIGDFLVNKGLADISGIPMTINDTFEVSPQASLNSDSGTVVNYIAGSNGGIYAAGTNFGGTLHIERGNYTVAGADLGSVPFGSIGSWTSDSSTGTNDSTSVRLTVPASPSQASFALPVFGDIEGTSSLTAHVWLKKSDLSLDGDVEIRIRNETTLEVYSSASMNAFEIGNGAWSLLRMEFDLSADYQGAFFELQLLANVSGSGFLWVDSMDIVARTETNAMPNFASQSQLVLENTEWLAEIRANSDWSFVGDLSIPSFASSAAMRISTESQVDFSGLLNIPTGFHLQVEAPEESPQMSLAFASPITVGGELRLGNVILPAPTSGSEMILNPGANFALVQANVFDRSLVMSNPIGSSAVYANLNFVRFENTPSTTSAIAGVTGPVFVINHDTGLASAENTVFMSAISFLSSGGAAHSVAAANGPTASIFIQDFASGAGFLDFTSEVDIGNVGGQEALTGAAIWLASATVQYAPTNAGERVLAAGAGDQVVAEFQTSVFNGTATMNGLSVQILSNIVDTSGTDGLMSIRLVLESGAMAGFQPGQDMVFASSTVLNDDPVLSFSTGSLSISGDQIWYIVADTTSSITPGATFSFTNTEFQLAGLSDIALFNPSLTGHSYSSIGFGLGQAVAVDANAPRILGYSLNFIGNFEETPQLGDQLILLGSGLHQLANIGVSVSGVSGMFDVSNVAVSDFGQTVVNIRVLMGPTGSPTSRDLVVTYQVFGGPVRTFTLAATIEH